jgi:hypothetical protein
VPGYEIARQPISGILAAAVKVQGAWERDVEEKPDGLVARNEIGRRKENEAV